jgi:hypothetical protein
VGFVVEKVALEQVSIRVGLFFPVRIIPPMFHTHLSTCCSYQKDKRAKPGNLPKIRVFFGPQGVLDRKVLSLFFAEFKGLKYVLRI